MRARKEETEGGGKEGEKSPMHDKLGLLVWNLFCCTMTLYRESSLAKSPTPNGSIIITVEKPLLPP